MQMPGEIVNKAHTTISVLSRPGIAKIHHDILSQIFFLLSRADASDIIYHNQIDKGKWDWVCVSEVCQFWHAVARGTPKLWTYIDNYIFCCTKRFQMSMKLSKNADLTVRYSEIISSEDFVFGNLKMAMKEMGRIVHLYLYAVFSDTQANEFLPYVDMPAPRMRSMSLQISTWTFASFAHFNLPSTITGVLKEVVLYNINAPSSISRYTCFSGLSCLKLKNCSLSLSVLLRILTACPALEVLHVEYCKIDTSDFSFAKLETIHLPYLKNIDLDDIKGFTIASAILQSIDAPNVSEWAVQCEDILDVDDVSRFEMFYSLLKRDFLAEEIWIQVNSCDDLDQEESSSFKFAGDKGGLSIEFDQVNRNTSTILKRWIEMFRHHLTKISLLDLQMGDDSIIPETWRVLLSACASAKILKVRMGHEDNENDGPPARTLRVVELGRSLPSLEQLVVYWSDEGSWENLDDPVLFIGDLEEFLRKRSMMGFPVVRVTLHSYEAESEVVLNNGLEDIAALRQWEEGVKRMRRIKLEQREAELEELEAFE